MQLTIFTPTFNRAYRLPALYESLKKQTVKDFEWLVVDDGSQDETSALFENGSKKQPSQCDILVKIMVENIVPSIMG